MERFGELNSSVLERFNLTDCSAGNFLGHQYQHPENPLGLSRNILGNLHFSKSKEHEVPTIDAARVRRDDGKRRKATERSESNSEEICSAACEDRSKDENKSKKKNGSEKKNKRRDKRKEEDKPEEVIHVRAKRGQATDTHSLAERVRRQKINNKLKCLQDLVPGCQKSMGLVTMLDEIISYVHSLKNQVEFLSTELESACSHQLIRNKRATENAQETGSHEAQEMGNWVREQY